MKHLGDITKINGASVPPVNVVIGGSPCQDLSVAGRRKGLKGERSGLFMEQIRIIKEMREKSAQSGSTDIKPRYMVWENVPGAFSSNKGQDFKAVLEETIGVVEEVKPDIPIPEGGWHYSGAIMGNGFSVAWRVFDAQFWGVPQRRRRIALVADFGGATAPEILFERESVSGDFTQSGTPWQEFTQIVVQHFNSADKKRAGAGIAYSFDSLSSNSMKSNNPNSGRRQVDIAKTIDTTIPDPSKNQGGIAVVYDVTRRHTDVTECEVSPTVVAAYGTGGGNTPVVLSKEEITVAGFKANQGAKAQGVGHAEEQSPTLSAANHDASVGGAEIRTDNKAPTLTAAAGMSGNNQPVLCIGNGQADNTRLNKVAGALNCMRDQQAVLCIRERCGCEGGGKGCLVQENQSGTLAVNNDQFVIAIDRAAFNQGINAQYNPEISESGINSTLTAKGPGAVCESVVRRLTPLECERLQGFPDGWTDIGEYIDTNGKKRKTSDSARYKALGNSIALPPWAWVLERISKHCGDNKTMASLFDGIGGFPLIWETLNGEGTCLWASEIEEFPIAVTKFHFKENKNVRNMQTDPLPPALS